MYTLLNWSTKDTTQCHLLRAPVWENQPEVCKIEIFDFLKTLPKHWPKWAIYRKNIENAIRFLF